MPVCGVPLARVHLPRDLRGFRRVQERWLLAKPRVPARPDNRGHGKNWTVGRRLCDTLAKECLRPVRTCTRIGSARWVSLHRHPEDSAKTGERVRLAVAVLPARFWNASKVTKTDIQSSTCQVNSQGLPKQVSWRKEAEFHCTRRSARHWSKWKEH